ncbi:MAG: enoyl-CoA hydratase/isomerase family protein [Xanthobacteraceae bacterium]|nr:enoyl-CoA hydratase/isomerase family protein [Xanthobacteraceae bacterium]
MSEQELIVVEERDTHAVIRINRPEKRNAMNQAARAGMLAALHKIRGRFPVAVLTGTDKSFCSGIDLRERHDPHANLDLINDPKTAWNEVNIAIRNHPAIFIAAVNGIALGGGVTLINVCDLAIAAESAQMGMPEMGFATYPGLAGPATQLSLPRKRAAWMILTTNRIDGVTAERWGLVNKVVPDDELLATAEELARQVSQFDVVCLEQSKQALDQLPIVIDWREAFSLGSRVNERIRSQTSTHTKALEKFNHGERNPGQGR